MNHFLLDLRNLSQITFLPIFCFVVDLISRISMFLLDLDNNLLKKLELPVINTFII